MMVRSWEDQHHAFCVHTIYGSHDGGLPPWDSPVKTLSISNRVQGFKGLLVVDLIMCVLSFGIWPFQVLNQYGLARNRQRLSFFAQDNSGFFDTPLFTVVCPRNEPQYSFNIESCPKSVEMVGKG